MVDSGASDCFFDEELVCQYGLPLCQKKQPVILEVVDGRPIVSGAITHETVPLAMTIGPHQEQLVLHVTTLGHYPVVLGVVAPKARCSHHVGEETAPVYLSILSSTLPYPRPRQLSATTR